jgi:hypothetical protein
MSVKMRTYIWGVKRFGKGEKALVLPLSAFRSAYLVDKARELLRGGSRRDPVLKVLTEIVEDDGFHALGHFCWAVLLSFLAHTCTVRQFPEELKCKIDR